MNTLKRGMVISVNFDPTKGLEMPKTRPCIIVTNDVYNERVPIIQVVPLTGWSLKKSKIVTNVEIQPNKENGLNKKSIADCLQTRPIDNRTRLHKILGRVPPEILNRINRAIRIVFELT